MKEETRLIAERLERIQRRYYVARMIANWVIALCVVAATVATVGLYVELRRVADENQDNIRCLVALVYAFADPERDPLTPPPNPCEESEVFVEESERANNR